MTALTLDELLAWTEEERGKWEPWFAIHSEALKIPLKGDRFGSIGGLVGHIFEAEWRQAHRLTGAPVPDRKDPANAPVGQIFASGRTARKLFREAIAGIRGEQWNETLTFDTASGPISVTKRKLALHLPLHEQRHWAQIARTVREHDIAPPGKHDLMFSEVIK
jgi:uncharacterized damage-inducible protein DinB